jgi:hypothetical protein
VAVEPRRGCGYRRVGGLYLVAGGLGAPCDRMPFPLDRCRTCGGGVKFTRGHTWLQPDFFPVHEECADHGACPVCGYVAADEGGVLASNAELGPHLLLWVGRGHYSPESYLDESHRLGVSRRLSALPKGLVVGETWVLLAHPDAVPAKEKRCTVCNFLEKSHHPGAAADVCSAYQAPKPSPGIFCAFVPRAVELILKQSDATPERVEKEKKRGVTVVAVPDDDPDHQGSVWDGEGNDSQPELPGAPA